MSDNTITNDHNANFSYPIQHGTINTTMANMSVVPQVSSRPNTLPINTQRPNNLSLFTPGDDLKCALSTPDLINALSTQPYNDEQSSPSIKILDEIFTTHSNNINNQPTISTARPFDQHNTYKIISNTINQRQENVPSFHTECTNSQISSTRNRSISSSMNDNESSTSTEPSSPMVSYSYSNRVKDELQHVPSIHMRLPGEPNEIIRKEKKRERNRQAAQKCRTRKLTRIAELQKRVNDLQGKNKDLTGIAECLKTDITKLEKQLQDHHTQGCTLMNGSIL